jgi:pimeloyl-ACP methyl ester carboxylesterase
MEGYLEAARSLLNVLRKRRSCEAMMRGISAPTLLIQGAQDRLVPVAAARLAARMNPTWRLEIYDDIGHTPQLEAPERFTDSVLHFCSGAAVAGEVEPAEAAG